jgi:hypothetical protein
VLNPNRYNERTEAKRMIFGGAAALGGAILIASGLVHPNSIPGDLTMLTILAGGSVAAGPVERAVAGETFRRGGQNEKQEGGMV